MTRSPTRGLTRSAGRGAEHASEPLGEIETELVTLMRMLEGLSRRSRVHDRLDRASYLLARTLDAGGPSTITALAERLGLDATTVTRQVAAMDDSGFVRRSRDPRDGRVCRVELTAKGRSRMDEVRAARRARIEGLVHDWSHADRRAFGSLLARFNAALRADATRRD